MSDTPRTDAEEQAESKWLQKGSVRSVLARQLERELASHHAELLAIHEAAMNPMNVQIAESDTFTVRRVKEFIQRAIAPYREEQLKKAFYETFHKQGEIFFPYPRMGATEEQCEDVTSGYWESFLQTLKRL